MILFFPRAEASLALLQAHTLALIFLQGGLLIPESDLLGGLLPIWNKSSLLQSLGNYYQTPCLSKVLEMSYSLVIYFLVSSSGM